MTWFKDIVGILVQFFKDCWPLLLACLIVALVMHAILGCSHHHDDARSPLPTVAGDDCDSRVCYPWTGRGPVKVIHSPFVDTCEVNGVCFYHCGRQ